MQQLTNEKVYLQTLLSNLIERSPRNSPLVSQLWSTMAKNLSFPKSQNAYGSQALRARNVKTTSFAEFALKAASHPSYLATQLFLVIANEGENCASEEIHSHLVIRMLSHLVLHVNFSLTEIYWVQFNSSSTKTRPCVDSFLRWFAGESREAQIFAKMADSKLFIVIDGVQRTRHSKYLVQLVKLLIDRGVRVLVTSSEEVSGLLFQMYADGARVQMLDVVDGDEDVFSLKLAAECRVQFNDQEAGVNIRYTRFLIC